MIFRCKHKFDDLVVYSDSTEKESKDYKEDFTMVTHHLFCTRCQTKLDLKYGKMIGSVQEFLKR